MEESAAAAADAAGTWFMGDKMEKTAEVEGGGDYLRWKVIWMTFRTFGDVPRRRKRCRDISDFRRMPNLFLLSLNVMKRRRYIGNHHQNWLLEKTEIDEKNPYWAMKLVFV